MSLAKAIVPGCKSLLGGTAASLKGLELMQVTKDNEDQNFLQSTSMNWPRANLLNQTSYQNSRSPVAGA